MLTEGWDANTVTHVLGVRAIGTQILCEQVIGRALRRRSYNQNEEGLFNVEYADVLGIPFGFTAKPVITPPQSPRENIQVKAVRPERDHLEIIVPNVAGYRVELPEVNLSATTRRCAAIAQTLSYLLMTAMVMIICSILLWRSRDTSARMPRRKIPPWILAGFPESTTLVPVAVGYLQNLLISLRQEGISE